MSWDSATLGDTVDLLAGFAFKSAQFVDEPDSIRLLRGDNIAQGVTRWDGAKRWSPAAVAGLDRYWLRKDDLVVAMDRPWIEAGLKFAPIRDVDLPSLLVQRVARLRAKPPLDQIFLRYVIGAKAFTDHVKAITTGANVPHISGRDILAYSYELPPFAEQRRIADILSAYDDLIENNTRRIAVLEDMARRLFEEWFDNFRYPDATDFEGNLPSGWQLAELESLCERITDGAHHSPPSVENGKPMASVRDMRTWGLDYTGCRQISEEDHAALIRADCLPKLGDILIAKDGANLNKHTFLIWREETAVILSSIAIIRPRSDIEREFLVAQLRSQSVSDAIKGMRTGAAIPRIILKDFKRLPLALPPRELRQAFEKMVGPIHMQCRDLNEANFNLRATRDLLLPKLISGKIEVRVAEEALEATAA